MNLRRWNALEILRSYTSTMTLTNRLHTRKGRDTIAMISEKVVSLCTAERTKPMEIAEQMICTKYFAILMKRCSLGRGLFLRLMR